MQHLQAHIEALIFCNQEPVSVKELQGCMSDTLDAKVSTKDVEEVLLKIVERYSSDIYPFEVVEIAGGYQFLTKAAYQNSISTLLKHRSKRKLSTSALETLAIVAYKQPVTKHQMEQIRGVNCDYSVQKLLEKKLIEIRGKSEAIGRPMLYGTNEKFMDYFGINSLEELPKLKDFISQENEIGKENES